jgi:hypothetical protein
VLARLADLAVPRVHRGTEPSALHLEFVSGISAAVVIESGGASDALFAIGRALRRIQSTDPRRFGSPSPGAVVRGCCRRTPD